MAATRRGSDGVALVLVSGGRFKRGSDRMGIKRGLAVCRQTYSHPEDCSGSWFDRETPQREIELGAFYIDRYEVTNARYAGCVKAGRCGAIDYSRCNVYDPSTGAWSTGGAGYPALKGPKNPVVCVTWQQAQQYCQWAGRDLPTDSIAELVAR